MIAKFSNNVKKKNHKIKKNFHDKFKKTFLVKKKNQNLKNFLKN